MSRYLLGVVLGATICCAVFAGSATAATWCVGAGSGCSDPTASGLSDALLFANGNPGPDTVQIDPVTITLDEPFPATDPVMTLAIAADTTLIGAGVGQTVFAYDGSMNVPVVLEIVPSGLGAGSASGFSVNLTGEAFPSNPGGAGVSVDGGTLSDFEIAKTVDNASGVFGLTLTNGATAHDGKITSTTAAFNGIRAPSGSATAHHIELVGSGLGLSTGVGVPPSNAGSTLNFHHLDISGFSGGVGVQNSHVILEDTLIDLGTIGSSTGVGATASPAGVDVDLDVNRVTIVGKGDHQFGFYLWSESISTALDATLNDYVVFGTGGSFIDTVCDGGIGARTNNSVSFGKHASAAFIDTSDECASDLDLNNRTSLIGNPPQFRDFNNGDYRLRHDSPMIDQGATGGSLPSDATDLEGGTRIVDGDASSDAANDLGAFEYQRTPPSISVQASTSTPTPGQPVTFTVTGSDAENETFAFAWAFDDGGSAGNVVAVERSFATPGLHTATVTATDEAGAASSAIATVTVPAAGTTKTATAKLTTRAKKAFVRSRSGFRKRTNPRATSFGVTFKNAQVARFELEQLVPGVRKGGKCVAKGSGRRCNFFKLLKGIQRIDVTDGQRFFTFGGRFNGKRLKPGTYRAKITPFGEGGLPGRPISVPFKLR